MKIINFNEYEYIAIGKIVSTKGLNGVLKANIYSLDFESLKKYDEFFLKIEDDFNTKYIKVFLNIISTTNNQIIFKIKNLNNILEIKKYINKEICIRKEHLEEKVKLKENEYYTKDLIGNIIFENYKGKRIDIGKVEDVINNGIYDTFLVSYLKNNLKKEMYIPNVSKYVKNIDILKKEIQVEMGDLRKLYEI